MAVSAGSSPAVGTTVRAVSVGWIARTLETVGWLTAGSIGLLLLTLALGWNGFALLATTQALTPYAVVLSALIAAIALTAGAHRLAVTAGVVAVVGLGLTTPLVFPAVRRRRDPPHSRLSSRRSTSCSATRRSARPPMISWNATSTPSCSPSTRASIAMHSAPTRWLRSSRIASSAQADSQWHFTVEPTAARRTGSRWTGSRRSRSRRPVPHDDRSHHVHSRWPDAPDRVLLTDAPVRFRRMAERPRTVCSTGCNDERSDADHRRLQRHLLASGLSRSARYRFHRCPLSARTRALHVVADR